MTFCKKNYLGNNNTTYDQMHGHHCGLIHLLCHCQTMLDWLGFRLEDALHLLIEQSLAYLRKKNTSFLTQIYYVVCYTMIKCNNNIQLIVSFNNLRLPFGGMNSCLWPCLRNTGSGIEARPAMTQMDRMM